jgi:hypothetical protein
MTSPPEPGDGTVELDTGVPHVARVCDYWLGGPILATWIHIASWRTTAEWGASRNHLASGDPRCAAAG